MSRTRVVGIYRGIIDASMKRGRERKESEPLTTMLKKKKKNVIKRMKKNCESVGRDLIWLEAASVPNSLSRSLLADTCFIF